MDRKQLAVWWDAAWREGLWAAPWGKSVEGLTPQQAAWKPAPGRHSIWQIVNHILFWREDALARLTGKAKPTDDEIARLNFCEPDAVNESAWNAALSRFRQSQERMAAAIADPTASLERIQYFIAHDCYHMGQINYLRAMQGLPAIE